MAVQAREDLIRSLADVFIHHPESPLGIIPNAEDRRMIHQGVRDSVEGNEDQRLGVIYERAYNFARNQIDNPRDALTPRNNPDELSPYIQEDQPRTGDGRTGGARQDAEEAEMQPDSDEEDDNRTPAEVQEDAMKGMLRFYKQLPNKAMKEAHLRAYPEFKRWYKKYLQKKRGDNNERPSKRPRGPPPPDDGAAAAPIVGSGMLKKLSEFRQRKTGGSADVRRKLNHLRHL